MHFKKDFLDDYTKLTMSVNKFKPARKSGHNYTYITLNNLIQNCSEICSKHGFIFNTLVESDKVIGFLHHIKTGEFLKSEVNLTIAPNKNPSQALGSAITYARRYALITLLNISPDKDDDGIANTDQRELGLQELRKIYKNDSKKLKTLLDNNGVEIKELNSLDLSEIDDLLIQWKNIGKED